MFIKYDELMAQPDEIVIDFYQWMDIPIANEYINLLEKETRRQKTYRSKHQYDLSEMGLSEEMIFREYEEVFQYYEFETHDFELAERPAWQVRGWNQNWKTRRILRREHRLQRRLNRRSVRRERKGQPNTGAAQANPPSQPF